MSWLRLDDSFHEHPKFAGWTARERWAWVGVMCYCARFKTGGVIPSDVRLLPKDCDKKLIGKAQKSGWIDADTGRIHDWDHYNPADPTKAARQARWRANRNGLVDARVDSSDRLPVDGPRAGGHARARTSPSYKKREVDLRGEAGAPSRVECPDCGVSLSGPLKLAEHTYHSHDGPEPEHWLEAERRTDDAG